MSSTTPEPLDASFQISLPSFEGPLDLLLHLIRKHELEILDLPIAFVTERYLAYVTMMEQLDLDIASEYLVMAATLAHIKSKMLLPQEPEDQAEDDTPEEEIDPRAELIKRLLEYQKYKDVAEQLGTRGIAGRDVFLRGSDAPGASGPPPLAPTSLFRLLDAFQGVLERAKADTAFEITTEGLSIQDRMRELTDLLREKRELTFEMLFEGQVTIVDLVVTFMALLEMAKRRLVRIYQADPHSPIHLRSTVLSEDAEADPAAGNWDDVEGAATETPAPSMPEDEASGAPAPEEDDDAPPEDLGLEEPEEDEAATPSRSSEPEWSAEFAAWDVRADEALEPAPPSEEASGSDGTDVDELEDTGLALDFPEVDLPPAAGAEETQPEQRRFGETAPETPVRSVDETEPTPPEPGDLEADAETTLRSFDAAESSQPEPRDSEADTETALRSFDVAESSQPEPGDSASDAETMPRAFGEDAWPQPEAGEPEADAETTLRSFDAAESSQPEPGDLEADAETTLRSFDVAESSQPEPGDSASDAETMPQAFDAEEWSQPEPGNSASDAETMPQAFGGEESTPQPESGEPETDAETTPRSFGEEEWTPPEVGRFGAGDLENRPGSVGGDGGRRELIEAMGPGAESEAPDAPSRFDEDGAGQGRAEEPVAVLHAVAVTDEADERDAGSRPALDPDVRSGKQSDLADSDEDEDEPT